MFKHFEFGLASNVTPVLNKGEEHVVTFKPGATLRSRLQSTKIIPDRIIDAILNAKYSLNGNDVYMFNEYVRWEVQEIIGIYFEFLDNTDAKKNPEDEFLKFLDTLMVSQQKKAVKDIIGPEGILFESPSLVEYRRQEAIKNSLRFRKLKPVKGINCRRPNCSSDEVNLQEKFSRSGDEGGVTTFVCAKCGFEWKDAG